MFDRFSTVNTTTLIGKVEGAAVLSAGLETFLKERGQNEDLAPFVELPLLYIGYLENGLDLGLYFAQLNNGNSANNAVGVTEALIDLISSIFIDNDLFAEYIKADVAPIVERLISGIDVTMIDFVKVKFFILTE